jgi:flagellar hook-associated protein 2
MSSSAIRFTGLASNLDTDSIVKQMLQPYKMKVDKQKQQQTLLDWKKDAWKEMNTKLLSFYNKQVANLRFKGTFSKSSLTATTSGVVDLTKSSGVTAGTHKIEVVSVASRAEVTGKITGTGLSTSTKLSDLDPALVGQKITVSDASSTLTDYTITADTTLGDIENTFKNNLQDTSVNFDYANGAIFMSSRKTGDLQKISISGDPTLLTRLGLTAGTTMGKSTEINYNDVVTGLKSQGNIVEVNGMKFSITATAAVGSATNIVVERDTDAIYKQVKSFIDEYNKLLVDINTKVEATAAKGYAPLTDEQKEALTDSEKEAWEKKIKDSLFRKDESLTSLKDTMRTVLSDVYEGGTYTHLSNLGIVTGDWREGGALHILGDSDDPLYADEPDKLKAAIQADPDKVIELINKIGDKLFESIGSSIKYTADRSKNSFYNDKLLDKKIEDADDRLEELQNKYDMMEELYYNKFTAMEKMMSQLNSQSSWIAQSMSS